MFLRSVRLRDWKAFTNAIVEFPAPTKHQERRPHRCQERIRENEPPRGDSSWASTVAMRWAFSPVLSLTRMGTSDSLL